MITYLHIRANFLHRFNLYQLYFSFFFVHGCQNYSYLARKSNNKHDIRIFVLFIAIISMHDFFEGHDQKFLVNHLSKVTSPKLVYF